MQNPGLRVRPRFVSDSLNTIDVSKTVELATGIIAKLEPESRFAPQPSSSLSNQSFNFSPHPVGTAAPAQPAQWMAAFNPPPSRSTHPKQYFPRASPRSEMSATPTEELPNHHYGSSFSNSTATSTGFNPYGSVVPPPTTEWSSQSGSSSIYPSQTQPRSLPIDYPTHPPYPSPRSSWASAAHNSGMEGGGQQQMRHSLSGSLPIGGSSLPSLSELVRPPTGGTHPIAREGEDDGQRKKLRLD